MASSSSSLVHNSFKYDVFLSFRGEDTRKSFIDHLYYALQHKSIHTYKDDERIEKGKRISDELIKSIQDSRFHIIVFSKNYASSSWCLEELVQIMECQKKKTVDQTAYPIFYDVEPSEVRKQSGEFGDVFATHEKEEVVRKWREALDKAAGLAGWELKNTVDGHEAKFIQKIVEEISLELRSINFSIDEKLIGMEARIRDVVSSLKTNIDDVRMTGIKGMGGAGKTTLARAIFDRISFQFEGRSFVENVRENSKPNLSGLKKLQKQVLRDVLDSQDIKISSVHEGKKMMKKMMCCRKVLVVLDDVDHIDQLKALAGELNWFNEGSRIIITTRDEQVLVAHRVKLIRDVNLLSHQEAICLFSRYTFGKESPIQGYQELSRQVVGYAAGLPLTITVLGSFLCGKNELEWKDAIERLKTIPLKETLEKLELSYISLEEDYKEIFLDVACILKGWEKQEAIIALESCGFHARNGLKVIEQKSLITISEDGCLDMHDRIEEMGKNIVRRKHEEPNKHSRLWISEEIEDVLVSDKGTNEAIRCIKLYTLKLNPKILMQGLGNMNKLRFLQVGYHKDEDCFDSIWKFDEVYGYFPNALQSLIWTLYPFGSLPKSFQANNLVQLKMPGSQIVQLWEREDTKVLNKLRFLDLRRSGLKNLDLGLTPNLETLDLEECDDLVELHMPDECPKLISLKLICSKLKKLDLQRTPNLKTLYLIQCDDVVFHMPIELPKLISLVIRYCNLTKLDLRGTPNLEKLTLSSCVDLVELHIPDNLKSIDIYRSILLRTLDLRGTPNLEYLTLDECVDLVELHIPYNLKSINIKRLMSRILDLRGTPNLEKLILYECVELVELNIPGEHLKLESIIIHRSKLRSLDLRGTPNLENLDLDECVDLVELHIPGECLKLKSININDSKLRTLDLRGTPNLKILCLTKCYHLVEVHVHDGCLKNLDHIDLSGCLRFKSFLFRKQLESGKVGCESKLHLIVDSLEMCPLHFGNNLPNFRFECFYEEHESSTFIENVEKLVSFGLCACTNLERFSQSICGLRCLTNLTLEGSIPEAPKDLDQIECLEELHLLSTNITHLPDSICKLKHLKVLKLESCWLLEKLPEDLGLLECLEKLILSECVFLRHIPDSICMMKHLQYFLLPGCILVETLPEEIGRLICLKGLNIEGTNIRYLPESIFELNIEGTSIKESIFEMKGLRIVAFRWLLQSYGFTNQIQTSEDKKFCYVEL